MNLGAVDISLWFTQTNLSSGFTLVSIAVLLCVDLSMWRVRSCGDGGRSRMKISKQLSLSWCRKADCSWSMEDGVWVMKLHLTTLCSSTRWLMVSSELLCFTPNIQYDLSYCCSGNGKPSVATTEYALPLLGFSAVASRAKFTTKKHSQIVSIQLKKFSYILKIVNYIKYV